jgi:hypothetical protein
MALSMLPALQAWNGAFKDQLFETADGLLSYIYARRDFYYGTHALADYFKREKFASQGVVSRGV